jgi:tRNA threonylcarbamoyladenosine biosynthesis protein TsaB
MLILALDTTTRAGSLALLRDDDLLEVFVGDAGRTHATRLPGDILACLARHRVSLRDVDGFGVAAGPGSFTGLRIGIATVQGLAFSTGRPAVAVSALDALAWATGETSGSGGTVPGLTAAWMDAQRGEVFGCLYRWTADGPVALAEPVVGNPAAVLEAWAGLTAGLPVTFTGDGALRYEELVGGAAVPGRRVVRPVPELAPAIGRLAAREASRGVAHPPHAIRPVYIRRPDAELARDKRGRTP